MSSWESVHLRGGKNFQAQLTKQDLGTTKGFSSKCPTGIYGKFPQGAETFCFALIQGLCDGWNISSHCAQTFAFAARQIISSTPLARFVYFISKLMIVDDFIARKQRNNFRLTLSILSVIATNSTTIEQQSRIFCYKHTNAYPGSQRGFFS